MYSFTMIATGVVSIEPTLSTREGVDYAEVALCGTDNVMAPYDGDAIHTHVQFKAFGKVAEAVMKHLREGDNVILFANMIETRDPDGEREFVLIIRSFRHHPAKVSH